ncbi:MAG: hypothetical protein GY798_30365 [Hyphomicrobiales bacterium]|nr:hypothetical protein [Hyphomicrobiales bacterium]
MDDRSRLRTLSQTFRFEDADTSRLAEVLAQAPLVGAGSIFGKRTILTTASEGETRIIHGFEPVPLFRFDVMMQPRAIDTGVEVIVTFSQPERRRPYLAGQFVWLLSDAEDQTAAILREEINTPVALAIVDEPLDGAPYSLRRFLFFAGGHKKLMQDMATNLRALLG